MVKRNKTVFLWVSMIFSILPCAPVLADTVSSTVTGEIIPGNLSMSKPNDLAFKTTLNGKKQTVKLDAIQTTISDYKKSGGWQLTVKSPNYITYFNSYQLKINNQDISESEANVCNNINQASINQISLPLKVEIFENARPGIYTTNLEWNLKPNIKNTIKE
ncbi:hypothetical protein ACI1TH_00375 [Lactococcus petauri]|uniref:hypothetical protein n=1 Tax=Lactococcus petauri TaxID=1940789 RepID=UPI003851D6E2